MELNDLLLREDVQAFLLYVVVSLITILSAIRYYRVVKADEDAELKVLAGYRSFTPVREYEDMEEDERLAVQRRAEALGWLDDYDEDDLERDRQRLSA